MSVVSEWSPVPAPSGALDLLDAARRPPRTTSTPAPRRRTLAAAAAAGLDPRCSFDDFVVGRSNRLAQAAALSVAENEAPQYNPLFLHGESGIGKTHLLHAIGLHVQATSPEADVRYVTSDRFTSDLISSVAGGDLRAGFARRYRTCSLLLVDDLQFLEGKVETQTELFHAFDEVTASGGRVVLSADCHPGDIASMPERLRSRFSSGLVADLEAPEFETRIAILARKAAAAAVHVPAGVLQMIAGAASRNVRELEGALTRVVADARLDGRPVSAEGAEASLSRFLGRTSRPITSDRIIEESIGVFGVSREDLCGYSRLRGVVLARQGTMYVCRALTEDSLPVIGRTFGGRDHTTVLHAVRRIEQVMTERSSFHTKVVELMNRLGGRKPISAS